MSSITLNIVEPTAEDVVVPVPDTGLYTSSGDNMTSSPELAMVITGVILVLALASLIAILMYRYRLHKNQLKEGGYQNKKRFSVALVALALTISTSTFTLLMANTNKNNTNATGDTSEEVNDTETGPENNTNNNTTSNSNNGGLKINTSNTEFTIELEDEPVFAVLPVEISVEEATQVGYKLSVYAEETDLVSTSDSSNVIPMVAADEGELAALSDDSYGFALVEPTSKEDGVYHTLPKTEDDAFVIKETDYVATEENDTTTVYYGFYITPDVPYGTYTGAEVNYVATSHRTDFATITFNGNGLYFDNDSEETTNVVRYIPGYHETKYSHTKNVGDDGELVDPSDRMYPTNTSETFVYEFPDADSIYVDLVKSGYDSCGYYSEDDPYDAFFSFWSGSHSDYTVNENYSDGIKEFGNTTGRYPFGRYPAWDSGKMTTVVPGKSITFAYTVGDGGTSRGCSSGYGYYARITGYTNNEILTGEYELPATSELEGYQLLGWSEDPNATASTYGVDDMANPNLFTIEVGDNITLYAVWTPAPFSINYSGNSATVGSMESTDADSGNTTTLNHEDITIGDTITLYAPNYKKDGYGFVGWSQDSEAWDHLINDDSTDDSVIYGPNQTIVVSRDMAMSSIGAENGVVLNAIWVPAEKDELNQPVYLQNWSGCKNLDATIYNAEDNTLSVGRNTITALTDNRDGEIYTVARLSDGNCWTTENLRIADTHKEGDETVQTVLTTDNTNNPLTDGGVVSIINTDGSTYNHLSPTNNHWCTGWTNPECIDRSNLNTNNTNFNDAGLVASYNASTGNAQWYSYGNYYNWYSATGATGGSNIDYGDSTEGSICPKGWILPYGGTGTGSGSGDEGEGLGGIKGGFYYLNQHLGNDEMTLGSNNWRSFPNNFVYSGNWYTWDGSRAENRGVRGEYWTSTASDSSFYRFVFTRTVYFSEDQIRAGMDSTNKTSGFAVRCVLPVDD